MGKTRCVTISHLGYMHRCDTTHETLKPMKEWGGTLIYVNHPYNVPDL